MENIKKVRWPICENTSEKDLIHQIKLEKKGKPNPLMIQFIEHVQNTSNCTMPNYRIRFTLGDKKQCTSTLCLCNQDVESESYSNLRKQLAPLIQPLSIRYSDLTKLVTQEAKLLKEKIIT